MDPKNDNDNPSPESLDLPTNVNTADENLPGAVTSRSDDENKLADALNLGKRKVRIPMFGLDRAGKTTILYQLKLGEIITTMPTIGFNVEIVEYKNISFTIWDTCGQKPIRPLWRHYLQDTESLIFVVDSTDLERVGEARDELQRLLSVDELHETVVLFFANKQDLSNAMSTEEIADKLDLHSLRNRNWYIQATSATSGDGLYNGLDWLVNQFKNISIALI